MQNQERDGTTDTEESWLLTTKFAFVAATILLMLFRKLRNMSLTFLVWLPFLPDNLLLRGHPYRLRPRNNQYEIHFNCKD